MSPTSCCLLPPACEVLYSTLVSLLPLLRPDFAARRDALVAAGLRILCALALTAAEGLDQLTVAFPGAILARILVADETFFHQVFERGAEGYRQAHGILL